MKTLLKISAVAFTLVVYMGCKKTELNPVQTSASVPVHQQGTKSYHDGSEDGGTIFMDKDKCKKCHTGRMAEINWNSPDNNYQSIEELVNDYDFLNNVHTTTIQPQTIVSEKQKQELINYLHSFVMKPTK